MLREVGDGFSIPRMRPVPFFSRRAFSRPEFCAPFKGNNMKSFHSTFPTGIVVVTTIFAALFLVPAGVVEASSLKLSSPQQFAQKANPDKAIAQCKSECAREFNSCVAAGCVGGRGEGGKCTRGEAIAGCKDKHERKTVVCQARCDN